MALLRFGINHPVNDSNDDTGITIGQETLGGGGSITCVKSDVECVSLITYAKNVPGLLAGISRVQ